MNVTKCLNGHFYDAEKYDVCPHCGAVSVAGKPKTPGPENKDQPKQRNGKKGKKDILIIPLPKDPQKETVGIFSTDKRKDSPDESAPDVLPDEDFEEKTPPPESRSGTKRREKLPPSPPPERHAVDPFREEEERDDRETEKTPPPSDDWKESLRSDPQDEGKTLGFFSMGSEPAQSLTTPKPGSEPVVGWLVCVKGVCFGKSFPLYAGRNSIGRSADNKVVLPDQTVSREKHAWITYEPKKRDFYVQPGEGSGLTYLNDDTVMESKKLAAKDRLEFGKGAYLLVPLCGEDFTWEDYMEKE